MAKVRMKIVISIGTLFVVLTFILVPICALAQQLPDYLELISADSMRYDKSGEFETTQIIGNVFFRKGQKELRCDHVTYYHQSEVTIFRGHVEFQDSSRYLSAEKVEYHADPERELAQGDVHLIVDQKEIFSDYLAYLVFKEYAFAEGDVRFEDSENQVQLFGQNITYDRNKEIGHAQDNPRLVKLDSLGNRDIIITGEHLKYDGKKEQATAEDSVVITQDDAVVTAQKADFYMSEDRVVIKGNPKVVQGHDQLLAKKIELFLEENRLRRAHLIGNGRMISNILIEGQPASDKITGDEIWIDMENDSLRYIHVLKQATSYYHIIDEGKVQGVNQVMGDEIEVFFEGGKVSQVDILSKPGFSNGLFTPAGTKIKKLKWSK